MRKIISVLFCLLVTLSSLQVQAKNDKDWMNSRCRDVLTTMKLKYKLPKGFIGKDSMECFESATQFQKTLTCIESKMCSEDKNFVCYFFIHEIFTTEDSVKIAEMFPRFKQYSVDKNHLNHIENDLKTAMGELYLPPIDNHFTTLPAEYAKKAANADVMITYPLTIKRGLYLHDLYKNCKVLILHKKGRGYIATYCFYNDEAAKKLDTYMKPVEGMFKYK